LKRWCGGINEGDVVLEGSEIETQMQSESNEWAMFVLFQFSKWP